MRRLLLAGAGHAHLFVLESLAKQPLEGVEVVLVTDGQRQLYSGMFPGYLAGQYPLSALTFELDAIAAAVGARLLPVGLAELHAERKVAELRDGTKLEYDIASLNIGSHPAGDDVPGVKEHAVLLKPLQGALGLDVSATASGGVLVVGSGAAGVELAFCIGARARTPVTIIGEAGSVPRGATRAMDRTVRGVMRERGISIVGGRVAKLEDRHAVLEDGARIPYGLAIWATGARAPDIIVRTNARVSGGGYLLVTDRLQSVSHPSLFGAGDCVEFASGQRV